MFPDHISVACIILKEDRAEQEKPRVPAHVWNPEFGGKQTQMFSSCELTEKIHLNGAATKDWILRLLKQKRKPTDVDVALQLLPMFFRAVPVHVNRVNR